MFDFTVAERTVRHTVRIFNKISLALCAVLLAGVLFAVACPSHVGVTIDASAAEPSYKMTDTYKASRFYKNFIKVTVTGDQRKDVISIALSQLGYHEGDSESDFGGDSTDGVRDFVEYNVLAGKYDNAQGNGMSYGYYWCASFVNWCLRQAGVSESASAGAEVSCQRWLSSCSAAGIYKSRGSYEPKSGDMIFFRDKGSSASSTHVGLVLCVSGGKVYTVEGNTSFTNDYSSDGEYVAVKYYELDSDYIVGYASPKYSSKASNATVDHTGSFKTAGQYMPHGRVTVFSDEALTESAGEMDAFTMFDVSNVSSDRLAVTASVGGQQISGYIAPDSDVVQVTTVEDVFVVEYVDEDGDTIFAPQYRLRDQKKRTYSNAPERSGRGFVGWRVRTTGEIIGTGAEIPVINENVTLTAVFDSNFYVVSFQNPDKTLIHQEFGYYGTPLNAPASPEAPEGYVFIGWDAEFGDVITGNATYTAQFVTQEEYESMTATETETESATEQNSAASGCAASVSAIPCFAAALAVAIFSFKRKKH